ncbi:MAG: response regulator [Opitutaceae bacterium]|nr:response regulator [Opitutaceae bacterium]
MTPRILFVDDDANLLAGFQRSLRKQFTFDIALGGPPAIELVRKAGADVYAVVVCDMRMPVMDGVKTLECIRSLSPDTVRIMLTGNADQQTAVDAVNRGQIFRFLNKPCPPEVLAPALETALKHHQLLRTERELIEGTLMGSIRALGEILIFVAPEAHQLGQNLREAIRPFAESIGAPSIWALEIAAQLSQIGMASVPANVVRKQAAHGTLTLEEEAMIQRVPEIGHDLLKGIPRLEEAARIILYQHKNFDGSGHPTDYCSGKDLPLGARMLKVLFDRMALERESVTGHFASRAMEQRKGVYDPELLALSFQCAPDRLVRPRDGERPPIAISVGELAPGQLLARDIVTPTGLTLVGRGNRLSPMMVERLRNLGELGEVAEPFFIEDVPLASPPG